MQTEYTMPGVVIDANFSNICLSMILAVTRKSARCEALTLTLLRYDGRVETRDIRYDILHARIKLVKMCFGDLPKKRERWAHAQ